MAQESLLFVYGKKEDYSTSNIVNFKINEAESEMFKYDLEHYHEKIKENLEFNDYQFHLGRFCGENNYISILMVLSLEVPGRLRFEFPYKASLDSDHVNKLNEFLKDSLGFEVII